MWAFCSAACHKRQSTQCLYSRALQIPEASAGTRWGPDLWRPEDWRTACIGFRSYRTSRGKDLRLVRLPCRCSRSADRAVPRQMCCSTARGRQDDPGDPCKRRLRPRACSGERCFAPALPRSPEVSCGNRAYRRDERFHAFLHSTRKYCGR